MEQIPGTSGVYVSSCIRTYVKETDTHVLDTISVTALEGETRVPTGETKITPAWVYMCGLPPM